MFWIVIFCNVVVPQLFWSRRARTSPLLLVGRLAPGQRGHVVRALHDHRARRCSQDFLPSSWAHYSPTWVDWSCWPGRLLLRPLFLLFLKFVPAIPISEVKELQHELQDDAAADAAFAELGGEP